MKLINTVFLSLVLCFSAYAGEGHDHNHEASVEPAPHGGMLRDSLPYKTELVINNDATKIYVYNKDLTPVALDKLAAEGIGRVRFPKEISDREVRYRLVGDAYEATIEGISKVHRYDLHVNIKVEQQEIVADFGVDNIH